MLTLTPILVQWHTAVMVQTPDTYFIIDDALCLHTLRVTFNWDGTEPISFPTEGSHLILQNLHSLAMDNTIRQTKAQDYQKAKPLNQELTKKLYEGKIVVRINTHCTNTQLVQETMNTICPIVDGNFETIGGQHPEITQNGYIIGSQDNILVFTEIPEEYKDAPVIDFMDLYS